jgi:hypothetical protein
MSNQTKPTPGPWKVVNRPAIPDNGDYWAICSEAHPREQLAKVYKFNLDAEANAAHIVKCVNLHEELVKALKFAVQILTDTQTKAGNPKRMDVYEGFENIREQWDFFKAALAKAEVE